MLSRGDPVAVRHARRSDRRAARRTGRRPPYDELRSRALEISLGDLGLAIVSRDDLIAMKRASARTIDLEDIAALTQT
jgi:hypothetical protein